jgi:hypothetical protein
MERSMPASVTLTVIGGSPAGREFSFSERTTCIAGRADDCDRRFVEEGSKIVSRHHCLFDINPPDVRVRDFGSLNGTFVNGEMIGRREEGQTPQQGARRVFLEHDLSDGDEVRVGDTVLRVGVFAEPPKRALRVCAKCGRDVAAEVGERRAGEFVCAACKRDPREILVRILRRAESGDRDLLAIRGYEVVKELGRGGRGAVFVARHAESGEIVALKVMLPAVAVEKRAKDEFLRETENTRALKHRNVVELRDAGCSQGTFFFTLELCDAGSVDQLMARRGGKVSVDEACWVVLQALDGLVYAHAAEIPKVKLADGSIATGRGLVHRDLKPHNLFMAGSGSQRVVKVGDFGLAKAFDQAGLSGHTLTGTVGGTVMFMPRQQLVNYKYATPEVDVWAMAATLYYMLTGAPPRHFPAGVDPIRVVLDTDAVPIRQRDRSIPQELASVIDSALVDKPQIGVKTAAELKRAIERAL